MYNLMSRIVSCGVEQLNNPQVRLMYPLKNQKYQRKLDKIKVGFMGPSGVSEVHEYRYIPCKYRMF